MDQTEHDGIQDELAELRAEVARMREERDAAADAADEADGGDPTDDKKAGHFTTADLSSELQALADVVDKELKDTNPVTLLVVFTLGAFVGRLLPR